MCSYLRLLELSCFQKNATPFIVKVSPATKTENDLRGLSGPNKVGCLWFVVIGFMFFAQHHVCDAYFVPAINVLVGKMKKSSNKWLQRWGDEDRDGGKKIETVKGLEKLTIPSQYRDVSQSHTHRKSSLCAGSDRDW